LSGRRCRHRSLIQRRLDERRRLPPQTKLSPSLVSHHLRLLRFGARARAERQGKQVFYCRRRPARPSVITDMAAHVGEDAHDSN